jgi:virginiamycin B lyase
LGALIQVLKHGTAKVLAQAVADVASGSTACGGKKGSPRTCSIELTLKQPATPVDIVIADYNRKPTHGKIPKSAKLLGYGRLLDKKLAPKTHYAFTAYLGGIIAGLSGNPGFVSLPGDGSDHSVAVVIDPTDFGNKPIVAGKKDPFANPIVARIAETGGSGHASLSLNGGAGTSSVTIAQSSDTVELNFDGGGTVGYGITVTLSAAAVKKSGGATETFYVSPLELKSSNAQYVAPTLALSGNGNEVAMDAGDLHAPATMKYTMTPSHCDAIASTFGIVQSGPANAQFTVLARGVAVAATPAPNATGCGITVSDGTSIVNVAITNTYSGVLGTPVITQIPIPTVSARPIEITVGPDGAMWFAEAGGGKIGRIGIAGGASQVSEFPLPPITGSSPAPAGLTTGPDGNLWWSDCTYATANVGKMTTAGVATRYPITPATSPNVQIATGSDGALWFGQYCDPPGIGRITTSGALTYHNTNLTAGAGIAGVALGPDGNIWFAEHGRPAVGKITPAGVITEFTTPNASSYPFGITAGPDGAMWFAECGNGVGTSAIGRIPVDATSGTQITEYKTGMTGIAPVDITTGPDGALWYTYFNSKLIGRITTAGVITEYPVATTSSSPLLWGMTAGPDGALWFTACDPSANFVGRVAIQTSAGLRRKHGR